MGGGGSPRITVTMPDDDGGERSYSFDIMLTMRTRKPYNYICKREYIDPYIESEDKVP